MPKMQSAEVIASLI